MRINRIKRVYFAGKVKKHGYRQSWFGERVMSDGHQIYDLLGGKVEYGGPFAISCDHGCWHHESVPHALVDLWGGHTCGLKSNRATMKDDIYGDEWSNNFRVDSKDAIDRCLTQIDNSDAVYAYIEGRDCYGTLFELGYTVAKHIPLFICLAGPSHKKPYSDLWFSYEHDCATVKECENGTLWFPEELLYREKTFKEKYHEYLLSSEWKKIRTAKVKEAGGRCQMCNGKEGGIKVHHRTYDNIFNEKLSDLIALCEPRHLKFHDIEYVS